jgi:hypothetical protein
MACPEPPQGLHQMGEASFRRPFICNPMNCSATDAAHDVIAWSVGLFRDRCFQPQESGACCASHSVDFGALPPEVLRHRTSWIVAPGSRRVGGCRREHPAGRNRSCRRRCDFAPIAPEVYAAARSALDAVEAPFDSPAGHIVREWRHGERARVVTGITLSGGKTLRQFRASDRTGFSRPLTFRPPVTRRARSMALP